MLAREGAQMAKDIAFPVIVPLMESEPDRDLAAHPIDLPAEYWGTVTTTCQQQMALGGYRLADIMRQLIPHLPPLKAHKSDSAQTDSLTVDAPQTLPQAALPSANAQSSAVLVALVLALCVSLLANMCLLSDRQTRVTDTDAKLADKLSNSGCVMGGEQKEALLLCKGVELARV
eukprot:GDKI01033910.1.p1 GENE.GDKI01033910.1~~GDKI01033910.1.p1  ORF type:complete len:174 (-),score=73.99 GDKI01033910.1:265-786(-)